MIQDVYLKNSQSTSCVFSNLLLFKFYDYTYRVTYKFMTADIRFSQDQCIEQTILITAV